MRDSWQPLGPIVRLQIQRDRLIGETYDPAPIVESDRLILTSSGALAPFDEGWMIDSHHRDHPSRSHWNADRTLSIGFTSHYAAMKGHFGVAPLGCAGENVTVGCDNPVTLDDLAGGVLIRAPGRKLMLQGIRIAQPCVPFTTFLLGRPGASDGEVAEHRDFLRDGMRGFVVGLGDLEGPLEIRVGDEVLVRS
jgi:hypothetical protein